MIKEISAKFTSRCSACGSSINPGDMITYDPAIKYSSRHKVCPTTVVKSDIPLNSPGRGALQGRGKSDFFAGEKTDIVRCWAENSKPLATNFGGTMRAKDGQYLTAVGIAAHYVSQEEADDFDLIGTDGSFSRHWSVTRYYRLATDEEAAPLKAREAEAQRKKEFEAQEKIARDTRAAEIGAQAVALLPQGIRPATREEYDAAWAQINQACGHNWNVQPAELVLRRDVKGDYRLPAITGNEGGYLGYTDIYQVQFASGPRLVVWCGSVSGDMGPSIQGVEITDADADLLLDLANRSAIKAYRFDPTLYAAMVAADEAGKLSKYGRGGYFGGTPRTCYDLPEAERPNTKSAYSRHDNHTSAEIRADLTERFRAVDNAEIVAILEREDSVKEIR